MDLIFEDESGLSRLKSVKEVGRDGVSVYPVQFTMRYSSANYRQEQSRMVSFAKRVAKGVMNRTADLLDMNGDGLPDVIDTEGSTHRFYFNQLEIDSSKMVQKGHGFSEEKANPFATSASLRNPSVQMLDFNGDGFTDMVDAVNGKIYINKGKGQWEVQSGFLKDFPSPGKNANRRFFDFNGDKAIDIIEIHDGAASYWVSDRQGKWVKFMPETQHPLGADFAKDKLRMMDMNGDGLSDAVQIYGGKIRYKKYFGYGQFSSSWGGAGGEGIEGGDPPRGAISRYEWGWFGGYGGFSSQTRSNFL